MINIIFIIGCVCIVLFSVSNFDWFLFDGIRVKFFVFKLEEELLGDDEELVVEGEGEKMKLEGDVKVEDEVVEEKFKVVKFLGFSEKGSDVVEEIIMKMVEEWGLIGEDLDEE